MVDSPFEHGEKLAITLRCATAEEWLKQVQELTAVAITEASNVIVFSGRWMTIRKKLERLPGQLADLRDSPGFSHNVLCKELLESVVSSLNETKDLALKCLEQSYGGKLQMQSSLDALAMKLGLHLQDCELLVKSGVLRESAPSNISRTGSGAGREAVRWTVKDLLARLQIGNLESKQKALDSLVELMQDDDKNVLVVAGQGGIPILVHLLDASLVAVREKAAAATCRLAQADSCEHLLVTEGAIAPLVRLLESGSPLAKEKAAAALQGLTFTPENARSVAAHGGISALVEICHTGTPGAQAAAAGALRNLASVAEVRQAVAEEGAIPVLIGLITSGTVSAQEHAADGLQNMASADDQLRQLIVREGGIPALMIYIDGTSSPRAQEVAMGALRNLAASGANIDVLLSEGFLPRLVGALRSGQFVLQQEAASAVVQLARSMEMRRLLGQAGCIPPLVMMLEAKIITAQEMAAQALYSLILVDSNRREFCKEERSISGMVQLLDPSNQGVAKKVPVSTLLCLSGSKRCRKRMISAGACSFLGKLADLEVPGAKKLLERLEGGRLWSIFKV